MPFYEEEAKQRQKASGGDKKSLDVKKRKSVPPNSEEPISADEEQPDAKALQREATAQTAKAMGCKRTKVTEAKRIKQDAPDLHEKVKATFIV